MHVRGLVNIGTEGQNIRERAELSFEGRDGEIRHADNDADLKFLEGMSAVLSANNPYWEFEEQTHGEMLTREVIEFDANSQNPAERTDNPPEYIRYIFGHDPECDPTIVVSLPERAKKDLGYEHFRIEELPHYLIFVRGNENRVVPRDNLIAIVTREGIIDYAEGGPGYHDPRPDKAPPDHFEPITDDPFMRIAQRYYNMDGPHHAIATTINSNWSRDGWRGYAAHTCPSLRTLLSFTEFGVRDRGPNLTRFQSTVNIHYLVSGSLYRKKVEDKRKLQGL